MPTKPKTAASRKPKAATSRKPAAAKTASPTKHQQVVDALRRPGGATLAELIELTGWQPHTVRAVLSNINDGHSGPRKIEQVPIESFKEDDGTRRWRIAD